MNHGHKLGNYFVTSSEHAGGEAPESLQLMDEAGDTYVTDPEGEEVTLIEDGAAEGTGFTVRLKKAEPKKSAAGAKSGTV